MCRECREFFPPPRVNDPHMHPDTCVTHVPWCMPGSLTSSFLWSWSLGKRSRHSRRMRNLQFHISGKRPIEGLLQVWTVHKSCVSQQKLCCLCYGHRTVSEYFLIINFNRFLLRVLLEAYNSTLLRILLVFILSDINKCVNLVYWHILSILFRGCWCPGALRRQVINSHGIQYLSLCLVISVFLSFDCTGGFVF